MTPIQTPNIFAPVSTPALAIRDLSFIVLAITGAIFLIVAGFAVYTLIRFGRRPTNPEVEPAQVYGTARPISNLEKEDVHVFSQWPCQAQ